MTTTFMHGHGQGVTCRGLLAAGCVLFALTILLRADDWPTYRHDNQRSGVTVEKLVLPLAPAWTFVPPHAPEPAWEAPRDVPVEGILELGRVQFDDAYHVAVADGTVFFGSSVDHRVMALDAATGSVRWSVFTEGPVRLAPTVAGGRVYVGSDDGFAYCLQAGSGSLAWKQRIGPRPDRLLGHGKMTSVWPIRTGVLVDAGTAYCGAGIWPAEGVYMQAMKADTGALVWRNDTTGESTDSIVSPQGYLLATADDLFVPQGRVSPAAYARATGAYKFTMRFGKTVGGTHALIADDILYTGTEELMSYHRQTRERVAWFPGRQVIVAAEFAYSVNGKTMAAMDRKQYGQPSTRRFSLRDQRIRAGRDLRSAKGGRDRAAQAEKQAAKQLADLDKQIAGLPVDGNDTKALTAKRPPLRAALDAKKKALAEAQALFAQSEDRQRTLDAQWDEAGAKMTATHAWETPCECSESLILAGDTLIAGGQDLVVAVDSVTGKQLWSAPVTGKARGLAVADGRLYVSTDSGAIHCFGASGGVKLGVVEEPATTLQTAEEDPCSAAAAAIVRHSGVRRGYALVLGAKTGRLAAELARRTELTVYAVCREEAAVGPMRRMLQEAGLYGKRVCVDLAPLDQLPYSDYFANLIVSELPLSEGVGAVPSDEIKRLLKPCGGIVMMGTSVMSYL
ncbi:MAG: PQQ-binding-like beta-propeller repeat protein [Lentisphaerae bacterium]|jgi:outer membrane protein assembly factor BamB|nr:PQQ-binding-like beta-propeller repeat protein [Lentisphaerota bacterium]MBT4821905.1 PQQ-binding-like beta-propeller repeat protein [Lentisphaerota bacterium]MBT5609990.1 PQQ-binding-like beta-propeller repeat protein [Lentisphaerota bacterium]MBT7059113.1 PQQ-binding-like beta-propeller repeat protein [Lentisphaerota bacterium]MBT7841435.1 PQQ-binding-like beta-propeller repeat protein [Lentisphaerota bacterium]